MVAPRVWARQTGLLEPKDSAVKRSIRRSSAGGSEFTSVSRLLSKSDGILPFVTIANHRQANRPAKGHLTDKQLKNAGV